MEFESFDVGEFVLIAVGCFIYLIDFVAVAVVVAHRDYPPFRAKQVVLISVSTVVWVQLVLGNYLWITCLSFRFFKLWRIIKQRKAIGMRFDFLFLLWLLPSVIVGIVATFIDKDANLGNGECQISHDLFSYLYSPFMLVQFIIFMCFAFSLRKIRSTFNEFPETVFSLAFWIPSGIFTLFGHSYGWFYQLWGRLVASVIVLLATNIYFWLIMGGPIFGWLFDRKEYSARFFEKVKSDSIPKASAGDRRGDAETSRLISGSSKNASNDSLRSKFISGSSIATTATASNSSSTRNSSAPNVLAESIANAVDGQASYVHQPQPQKRYQNEESNQEEQQQQQQQQQEKQEQVEQQQQTEQHQQRQQPQSSASSQKRAKSVRYSITSILGFPSSGRSSARSSKQYGSSGDGEVENQQPLMRAEGEEGQLHQEAENAAFGITTAAPSTASGSNNSSVV